MEDWLHFLLGTHQPQHGCLEISIVVRLKRAYAGGKILSSSDIADRPNEYLVLLAANEYMMAFRALLKALEHRASI